MGGRPNLGMGANFEQLFVISGTQNTQLTSEYASPDHLNAVGGAGLQLAIIDCLTLFVRIRST